jgi:LysM repeat protein
MSQSLVFTLLALALALPIAGAVVLRLLSQHLSAPQLYGMAALIFAVVFGSVLVLARANVSSIQVGELSLLLPVADTEDLPANTQPPTADVSSPPLSTAEQPTPAATSAPTGVPTTVASPTASTPTETLSPVPPTETPSPIPPTETPSPIPPTETPQPAGRRTYVVQSGDTLRGIAEQFNVTVQAIIDANNLTAAQADSLRPGQELVIP